MPSIVRLSKKELLDLIEETEAAGNDTTELRGLLAEVEERYWQSARRRVPPGEMTTEEHIESLRQESFIEEGKDLECTICHNRVATLVSDTCENCFREWALTIKRRQPARPPRGLELRADLLGRIFHEFLPPETRKRLGAFYTRPQAAEMLAGLAIGRADEKVLDPACGSGTLLVSAYRKKMTMGKARPHKKLVEEELTGIDIMPFAAHLAALNLTMQSPVDVTNKTRIGIGNSLHLARGNEIGDVTRWLPSFFGRFKNLLKSFHKSRVVFCWRYNGRQ